MSTTAIGTPSIIFQIYPYNCMFRYVIFMVRFDGSEKPDLNHSTKATYLTLNVSNNQYIKVYTCSFLIIYILTLPLFAPSRYHA